MPTYAPPPTGESLKTIRKLMPYLCDDAIAVKTSDGERVKGTPDETGRIRLKGRRAVALPEACATCESQCAYGRQLLKLTRMEAKKAGLKSKNERGERSDQWLRVALHPNGIGQNYALEQIKNSRKLAGLRL